MRSAILCGLTLLGGLAAGCAGAPDGAWTITAEPRERGEIATDNLSYALDLDATATSWTGRYEGSTPRRVTLEYSWTGAPGLRAAVGTGERALECSPGDLGIAGEGDGYAWTIQPLEDGCTIRLVLVTWRATAEDISWRIDGWTSSENTIRATLESVPHP